MIRTMTEVEARKTACPFFFAALGLRLSLHASDDGTLPMPNEEEMAGSCCLGAHCQMWDWELRATVHVEKRGYCGLKAGPR